MLYVTTSWDDGDALDRKLAKLLESYGIRGTFYIPRSFRGIERSAQLVQELALYHEVGAHTLTHPDLRTVSISEARNEIAGGKDWLESVLGKEIKMFCYPRGSYTNEIRDLVGEYGYLGARTTRQFSTELPRVPFEMETTLQVYPFPFRPRVGIRAMFGPVHERLAGFRALGVPLIACRNWRAATIAAFDRAYKKGGAFHIWGHSWEIEQYGMWSELESVLMHMRSKKECAFVINSELLRHV
ncbi:MAG: polysaccharide deacetylase family protein [Candidatus Pacebacteria bacterium]|nr:polysaccharide deacetylase family protein [Candidatus Paceibacterota bacterium]